MIDPMLLHHAPDGFVLDDSWILELKYDGVRAILDTTGNEDVLYTRNGHVITEQFPEISAPKGLLLDGEIVGFDGKFHKLNWVQRRLGVQGASRIKERAARFPVTYVAFDMLRNDKAILDGETFGDMTGWTYNRRRASLSVYGDKITVSPVYPAENIDKMWSFVRSNNLEGLVAKRTDSRYAQGTRSYSWLKIKHEKPEYRSK